MKQNEETEIKQYEIFCMSCTQPHYLNGVIKLEPVKWVCPECLIKFVNDSSEESEEK